MLTEKIKSLFTDAEFVNKMKNTNDLVEVQKLFAEAGVELTEAEMKEFIEEACANTDSGEIDEKQLENVSGGIIGALGILVGFSWSVACDVYGSPKKAVIGITSYWMNKFR